MITDVGDGARLIIVAGLPATGELGVAERQRAFTETTLKQWWTTIERPSREELALFDPPIS